MPIVKEPAAHIRQSLDDPIGAPPLRELVKGRKDACIVVSDATRPVPNREVLPPLIDKLQEAGMSPEKVSLLIATGIHRAPTPDELVEILGEEILRRYRIITHDARERTRIRRIGYTSSGTPIDINEFYLESDLKIVVGLVEPHFMAGYSGGRKSIAVGLTSVDAIRTLHGPAMLEQTGARNCELKSNPLQTELLEIAAAAGADMCVNVVLDSSRKIADVFTGDLALSHLKACDFAACYSTEPGTGLYDIVVTTAAGYPLDATYYQAVKGLVGALDILAPGGSIILAAECSHGLGSVEFREGLELLKQVGDHDRFIEYIAEPAHFHIDQWEVEMLVKVLRRARIYLYSEGLSEEEIDLSGATQINSVGTGMHLALADAGQKARVAVIPEGPYFIPLAAGG